MSEAVTFKKRVRKGAPITTTLESNETTDNNTNEEHGAEDETPNATTIEANRKRARVNGVQVAQSKALNVERSDLDANLIRDLTFESSRSAAPAGSGDAFATAINIMAGDVAERVEAEQRRLKVEADAKAAGPLGDGVFRGQAGFAKFTKDNEKDKPKAARIGPQSGSAYARVSCVFDYAMGICKDWKDSGTCGYGDNCIYLHDRTDYKAGWELERDYDAALKAGRDPGATADPDDKGEYYIGSDDDEAGGAAGDTCGICNKPLDGPVETKCGHRFCAKCAKKRVIKGKLDCAKCGVPTNGIFNVVKTK